MAITINGSANTVAGLAVGGLPDGTVDADTLANNFDDKIQSNIALLGFKTASNGSLAKYNLVDQVVDEFVDATGIDTSASTGETLSGGAYLGSSTTPNYPTGGTVTTYGNYNVHSFLSGTTNFVVPYAGTCDILAVAGGGGGGGSDNGGGGGAGGMIATAGVTVAGGTYSIVIGAGGTGGAGDSSDPAGGNGENTTTGGLVAAAVGGGGGANNGRNDNSAAGAAGGSGGGGGEDGTGGAGTAGQGNAGKSGASGSNGSGGGGGAGEAGGTDGDHEGGDGLENDYRTGSNVFYAGGGGAGSDYNSGHNAGGQGGGGQGDGVNTSSSSWAGTANTGGGGGGAGEAAARAGGAGGSGIVVIRYNKNTQFQTTFGADMTLVSTATEAETEPTKADFVMLIEDIGTITVNTDIKAYISKDDGSTYTQATLVDEGDWGTNKRVLVAHDATPGGSSDKTMRYKITTHNSTSSKYTKVHATSLGWK